MSAQSVNIPDDRAFASFKAECLCEEGWSLTYNKGPTTVWTHGLEEGKSVHKIKVSVHVTNRYDTVSTERKFPYHFSSSKERQ